MNSNVRALLLDRQGLLRGGTARVAEAGWPAGLSVEWHSNERNAATALAERPFDLEIYCLGHHDGQGEALARKSLEQHRVPARFRVFLYSDPALLRRVEAVYHGIDLVETVPADLPAFLERVGRRLHVRNAPAGPVLLLDDDPLSRAALGQVLRRYNVEVHTAATVAEFWTLLEQGDPAAALLDMEMAGINGLEICRVLRASLRWRYLPVVVMTSSFSVDTRLDLYAAGADDFITKPVLPEEIGARVVHRVRRELERRLGA